ncbi:MAG: hypothetical protein CBD47_02085 [Synechococcus sp. TMED187]|nr:MAG: hypothetical protein CBD47_02085 [Synechococcus sp. TMED187]
MKSIQMIIATLFASIKSVAYLAMLLLLIVFIFALLGMEFFGGRYPRPEYYYVNATYPDSWSYMPVLWGLEGYGDEAASRYNFDSVGDAFLAIFVVLSGENWNEIYFDQHRATWDSSNALATIYFLCLFVIGNLLLFNLFIAILLSSFDEEPEEEEGGDDVNEEKSFQTSIVYSFGGYRDARAIEARTNGGGSTTRMPTTKADGKQETASTDDSEVPEEAKRRKSVVPDREEISGDKSLCLFSWKNPVRRTAAKLVWHPFFDNFIVVLILVSSLLLAVEWPGWWTSSPQMVVLMVFDRIFTVLFTLEMLLKIVVLGFVRSKTPQYPAYLRSVWNVLDFVIVAISLTTWIGNQIPAIASLKFLKAIRTLRALRPLRLISRAEGMKQVINTLGRAMTAVGALGVVLFLFFSIFAILGMELFAGKFGYCLDPEGRYDGVYLPGLNTSASPNGNAPANLNAANDFTECMSLPKYNLTRVDTLGCFIAHYDDPSTPCGKATLPDGTPLRSALYADSPAGHCDLTGCYPGAVDIFYSFPQWRTPGFGHFDNVGVSLLLLFELAALEGWPDVMHWAMDTDSQEMFVQPERCATVTHETSSGAMEQRIGVGCGALEDESKPLLPKASDGWICAHQPNVALGSIFFVMWIIIGCFVFLNMVVGVVLDTFNKIREENDGCAFMTDEQAEWVSAQKSVFAMRPLRSSDPPTQQWRLPFYRLVTWFKFDMFIMAVIILNLFQMATAIYDPRSPIIMAIDGGAESFLGVSNLVFFVIYFIEMVLKLIGLGPKQYFKDPWNCFDFFLVVMTILDIVLENTGSNIPIPPTLIRVMRLFRIVRILRVFKTAKQLRTMLMTIVLSLPALGNVSTLMLLFLIIFSVLNTNLYWMVYYSPWFELSQDQSSVLAFDSHRATSGLHGLPDGTGVWPLLNSSLPKLAFDEVFFAGAGSTSYGDGISRHANFENFGSSMLTLARCVTGESFNGVMHDLMDPEWGDNMLRCCSSCGPPLTELPVPITVEMAGGASVEIKWLPETSCGQSVLAVIVFLVFYILLAFIGVHAPRPASPLSFARPLASTPEPHLASHRPSPKSLRQCSRSSSA